MNYTAADCAGIVMMISLKLSPANVSIGGPVRFRLDSR